MRRPLIGRLAVALLFALPLAAAAQTPPQPVFLSVTVNGAKITGVGTGAGTVAAGNDSRIVGAVQGPLSTALDAAFGATQGGVLYRGASAWALLGPGSSGQVLGSGGASANPAWVTPAGGTTGTQAANTALMGPASGTAAAPGYRALVAADAPFAAPVSSIAGLISGLRLSNDATTPATVLDVAAGVATSDDGSTAIKLASAVTKTTAAWAAGTGAGGLDTGTVAASTWYHVFLISGTSGTDVLLSKSATAPTMPSGATVKRRIGAIKTNGSSQILAFSQFGDRFDWSTPTVEINGVFGSTTATVYTFAGLPPGVQVQAIVSGEVSDTSATNAVLLINSPLQADNALNGYNVTAIVPTSGYAGYNVTVVSNTSAQLRVKCSSTTMSIQVSITGYIDTRGR